MKIIIKIQMHKKALKTCDSNVNDKPIGKNTQSLLFPTNMAYNPYIAKGIKVIPIYSPKANREKAFVDL